MSASTGDNLTDNSCIIIYISITHAVLLAINIHSNLYKALALHAWEEDNLTVVKCHLEFGQIDSQVNLLLNAVAC